MPLWPWELDAVVPLVPDGGVVAPGIDGEPLDDWLPGLWLPDVDEGLLELWLLEDWLLEELLDDELLELELELELDELGGCGMVGVVGLLALGQPVSATQATTARPSCISCFRDTRLLPLCRVIGPHTYLCLHRIHTLKPRAEAGLAQLPHQPVGLRLVFKVLVQPVQVNHPARRRDRKF